MSNIPRLIIAAPMSGSGKTTITAALIAALVARGLRVAPFKVGPDYIDPTYHTLAAGRACHNLDSWMLAPEQVAALFARHTRAADIALIEGVMGLFDGVAGRDDTGSSAHIARITATPVLLVLDAKGMARTAAALVRGLRDFDPLVHVAGVILNRVGSARHAALIRDALADHAGIPVLGHLARDAALHLPERHLGLVPTTEPGAWAAWLAHASAQIAASVDLDALLDFARAAPDQRPITNYQLPITNYQLPITNYQLPITNYQLPITNYQLPRIAIARDEAFSFLYADNLDLLRAAGAELAFFSPLRDAALPEGAGAVWLCGGFPELYAADLAANTAMLAAIRAAAAAGTPIYAECGGLMYLTEAISDQTGATHTLAGLLPGRSAMGGRLTMGYRTARASGDGWLWRAGETVRGHEFHYSTWQPAPDRAPAYELLPGGSLPDGRPDGAQIGSVFASYIHLHLRAFPALAGRFVAAAAQGTGDRGQGTEILPANSQFPIPNSQFPIPNSQFPIPRPALAQVPAVAHGGYQSGQARDLLDFSSNVNPFGAPPGVWEAMRAVPLDRHPDPRARPLRAALADQLGLAPEQIIVGNGSVDLIYQIAVAFVRPGDRVLVVGPTFGEYAAAAAMMGAHVSAHTAQVADGFQPNVDALIAETRRLMPRLLFLCNPNNPTGVYLDQAAVAQIIAASPATLVVLDEAYIAFAAQQWDARSLLVSPNLLLLRSLTKDYALTALRVGYALAAPPIIAALETVQPPWSVNALAQAASIAALRDAPHLRDTLAATAAATAALRADLRRVGWDPLPSSVNYFLLAVPDAARAAARLRAHGIGVRDCTSFGLPQHIRVAARTPVENARLVAALAALRAEINNPT